MKKASFAKILPPLLLALALLLIYLGTIAPGLTWANDGADGGDLITAAASGGIAHPTGYPVYLITAQVFQFLPIGSLAFRTNLLSALAAVLASVAVYGIIVWLPSSPVEGNWLAGMVGALFFGIAPVVWSQAVITEVYTLHAALVAVAIFLVLCLPLDYAPGRLDRWRGLVLGLSVGNHLTSILFLPAALISSVLDKRWKIEWRSLLRISAWLGAGLLVYVLLPIRSVFNPPVNWGSPVSLRQFIWLVTGELYQRRLMDISVTGILERLQSWSFILLEQFSLPGITLALIGLIYFFKPTKMYFITIWNMVVFSLFAILYASFDSYLYLIPVFLSFSIWIGLGVGGLFARWKTHEQVITVGMAIIFSFLFAVLIFSRWPQVDASHDDRAEKFGLRAMEVIPQNAIVFAKSDRAIFALWYYHYALQQRKDIIVAATDMLHFIWYADTLRSTYPAFNWPEEFLWPETVSAANPLRPVCKVSYFDVEEISCK